MPQCYVNNCTNYYGKTRGNGRVSYHMIPSLPSLALKWAKVCTGKNHTPPRYMRVCSDHFSEKCYQRDLQHELLGLPLRRRLKSDAVPDMKLPGGKKMKGPIQIVDLTEESASCVELPQPEKIEKTQNNQSPNNQNKNKSERNKNRNKSHEQNKIANQSIKIRNKSCDQLDGNHLKDENVIANQIVINFDHNPIKNKPFEQNVIVNDEIKQYETDAIKNKSLDCNEENAILNKSILRSEINLNKSVQNRIVKKGEAKNKYEENKIIRKSLNQSEEFIIINESVDEFESNEIVLKSLDQSEENKSLNRFERNKSRNEIVNKFEQNQINVIGSSNDKIQKFSADKNLINHSTPKNGIDSGLFLNRLLQNNQNGLDVIEINTTHCVEFDSNLQNADRIEQNPGNTARIETKHPPGNNPTNVSSVEDISKIKNLIILEETGSCGESDGREDGAKTPKPVTFKIPMRSSVRLAKRETFESAADFKSPKLRRTKANVKRIERERLVRKIKYMRQLNLNFLRNVTTDGILSPGRTVRHDGDGLNKMHIMEDVREGCDTQPSSPGHAEQRDESMAAQSDEESSQNKPAEEDCKTAEEEDTDENNKEEKKQEDAPSPKRKSQSEEAPAKKPKSDVQQEFFLRNKILSEYTESLEASNFEQIQAQTEQLIVEIHSLSELAKEKEREWNQIIHERKLKEELLLRIQRQKQVYLLSNGLEISESDPVEDRSPPNGEQARKFAAQRRRQELNRPKLQSSLDIINGHESKLKQRPVRDVQSIIADYRQRHPETVPRRGRRIRSIVNGDGGQGKTGGVLNFSNVALGSGSQVRQNAGFENPSELGMLLSAMESQVNQDSQSNSESHDTTSFKDILVRFAKLSQSERQELLQSKPPPPYPEVTVHAVSTTTPTSNSTNSLLHGILTKTQNKAENKSSFSPTLARLLTAPERSVASQQNQPGFNNSNSNPASNASAKSGANVSISDILSSNKARNEITITPVGAEYDSSPKRKSNQMDEEEAEDSVDRLVIDESGEIVDARTGDNNSDTGDEVPQCQGCNVKAAQFVCAGCGNQWYCSRECQVTAWDEHSEVCSG